MDWRLAGKGGKAGMPNLRVAGCCPPILDQPPRVRTLDSFALVFTISDTDLQICLVSVKRLRLGEIYVASNDRN